MMAVDTTVDTPVEPEPSTSGWERFIRTVGAPALAVFLALVVGAVVILLVGGNPIAAYAALVVGAVGSRFALGQLLVQLVPLLVIGLGLAIAFRGRVWNIGAEGQFHAGALIGGAVALFLAIPWGIAMIPLVLVAGAAAGAAWGWIVGFLRGRWRVNEVISSLLLNFVAVFAYSYAIRQPLRDPDSFLLHSARLPEAARLPQLPFANVHTGLILALALVPLVAYVMSRTPFGFRTRIMGANREAARAAGIDTGRMIVRMMLVSGGLAGLAGAIQLMGVETRLQEGISAGIGYTGTSGFGFTGIVVALLGRLNAVGVLIAAAMVAGLSIGGEALQRSQGVPFAAVYTIQALFIVFLLVADRLARR